MYYTEKIKKVFENYDSDVCGNACNLYNLTAFGVLALNSVVRRNNTTQLKRNIHNGIVGSNY